jgi:uncharacterized protein
MTEATDGVQALIEQVAKALVDEPDQVSVEHVIDDEPDGEVTVFELTVAEGDLGRVIGRNGRTARAMRALIGAAGVRAHQRFALEILE